MLFCFPFPARHGVNSGTDTSDNEIQVGGNGGNATNTMVSTTSTSTTLRPEATTEDSTNETRLMQRLPAATDEPKAVPSTTLPPMPAMPPSRRRNGGGGGGRRNRGKGNKGKKERGGGKKGRRGNRDKDNNKNKKGDEQPDAYAPYPVVSAGKLSSLFLLRP